MYKPHVEAGRRNPPVLDLLVVRTGSCAGNGFADPSLAIRFDGERRLRSSHLAHTRQQPNLRNVEAVRQLKIAPLQASEDSELKPDVPDHIDSRVRVGETGEGLQPTRRQTVGIPSPILTAVAWSSIRSASPRSAKILICSWKSALPSSAHSLAFRRSSIAYST
eukprot:202359-Hanusia_phi.AAC.1